MTDLSAPSLELSHGGRSMPLIGLGLAVDPSVSPEITKSAILRAIELGYRHFDIASKYGTERPLGDAIRDAIELGLIGNRDEVFVTSKLWVGDAHPQLVVAAIERTLSSNTEPKVQLNTPHHSKYMFAVSRREHETRKVRISDKTRGFCAIRVGISVGSHGRVSGLTKCIGVSNFSCKKLREILAIAKIPPAANQVEVNPFWQQRKLIELCKANVVLVTAYSRLSAIGTFYGSNRVLECQVLKGIAKAKGKTVPQLEMVARARSSCSGEELQPAQDEGEPDVFNWELSEEDHKKIRTIPQSRGVTGWPYISCIGPIKTLEELWDGEI
ncbi:Non-functional NADPH-dependent codeinone reductase 2-like protein [Drosera capensis]